MNETTIIAVGELLVEFISHRKGCALRELAEYTGPYASGAPAICIDQAARMGAQTTLFGGLGSDNFGNVLTDRLQASGVDTSSVLRLENKTTGVAFVSYYDDGSRTFIFHLNDTAADAIADTEFVLPEGAASACFWGFARECELARCDRKHSLPSQGTRWKNQL